MGKRGGRRVGAGRKAKPHIPLEANKRIATEVLAMVDYDIGHKRPDKSGKGGCDCERCTWFELLHEAGDRRLRFDVLKYLTDRRDGKPVQMLAHTGGGKETQPIRVIVEHIGQRPKGPTAAQAK